VIIHEWGIYEVVSTTNGTNPESFVTQTVRNC